MGNHFKLKNSCFEKGAFHKADGNKDEYSINDAKEAFIKYKKEFLFRVKVTTYIKGPLKNRFLEDCLRKKRLEVVVARNIFDLHYAILEVLPECGGMEFTALKQYIIDKIKFK